MACCVLGIPIDLNSFCGRLRPKVAQVSEWVDMENNQGSGQVGAYAQLRTEAKIGMKIAVYLRQGHIPRFPMVVCLLCSGPGPL